MQTNISVVTPVFNESENIKELCAVLDGHAKDKKYTLELVFVDDGSSDETLDMLREFPFIYSKVKIVSLSKNYGSHAAVRAGLSQATSEYTMLFSGDLQEPIELVDKLYDEIRKGFDVVYVQKGATKVGKGESFFSNLYTALMRKFAVSEFPAGGLNNFMITSKVRKVLTDNVESNSSFSLQLVNLGFKRSSVSCDYLERAGGTSKWTFQKKVKMFIDSFIAFSFAPIRAVSVLGVLLAAGGGMYGLYIIIVKLFNIFPFSAGFPTLIAVLLLGFGLTNLSIGILAEYIWRTLDVARGRPVFLIDTVDERNYIELSNDETTEKR